MEKLIKGNILYGIVKGGVEKYEIVSVGTKYFSARVYKSSNNTEYLYRKSTLRSLYSQSNVPSVLFTSLCELTASVEENE